MIRFFVGVILFCAALWTVLITVGLFASIGARHAANPAAPSSVKAR